MAGRKPKGDRAMTPAERKQASRVAKPKAGDKSSAERQAEDRTQTLAAVKAATTAEPPERTGGRRVAPFGSLLKSRP